MKPKKKLNDVVVGAKGGSREAPSPSLERKYVRELRKEGRKER
jgi:hypothetical protein